MSKRHFEVFHNPKLGHTFTVTADGTPSWMRAGEPGANTGYGFMEFKSYIKEVIQVRCTEGYTSPKTKRWVGKETMLSLTADEARQLAHFLLHCIGEKE